MKNNDDLLSVQGDVYTLVDAEGYLVREDIKNGRVRYPISGGQGQDYSAGSGLLLDNAEFSVDFTEVAGKNEIISYSAGSGLLLDNAEFSVDFTEVAKPYSAGSGLTLSGQEFNVNFTEVCKSIDNLSASDKDKLNKLVLELDWEAVFSIPTLNTLYQADRSGILQVNGIAGSNGAALGAWVYSANPNTRENPVVLAQTLVAGKAGNFHIVVPKNDYFLAQADGLTSESGKFYFIPFKNSIANS